MGNLPERRKKWMEDHERLSRLFVQDRLAFERERRKRIEQVINQSPSPDRRGQLRKLQKNWDTILKNAGSPHNRFVLIQTLFWRQVRDIWGPAVNDYETKMRKAFGDTPARDRLTPFRLVRK